MDVADEKWIKKTDRRYLSAVFKVWNEYLVARDTGSVPASLLKGWFLYDTWCNDEALMLLHGFQLEVERAWPVPSKSSHPARRLEGRIYFFDQPNKAEYIKFPCSTCERVFDAIPPFEEEPLEDEYSDLMARISKFDDEFHLMREVLNSGSITGRNPPLTYITWAESKGFRIPWINWARSEGLIQDRDHATPVANQRAVSGEHVSRKLSVLNQAADRFWSNADPKDRDTHPTNAQIAAWLEERGFTQTLAKKAASIIRPEWAPAGRKPDQ